MSLPRTTVDATLRDLQAAAEGEEAEDVLPRSNLAAGVKWTHAAAAAAASLRQLERAPSSGVTVLDVLRPPQ